MYFAAVRAEERTIDLKKRLIALQDKRGCTTAVASSTLLIHRGKILQDIQQFQSIKIGPCDTFVVLRRRKNGFENDDLGSYMEISSTAVD